jgi:hypothetical protein
MRRTATAVLLCIAVLAITAGPAGAKPKPKPPTIKVGTYKAKVAGVAFNIKLAKTKCTTTPGQGTPAIHLCVSLPTSPEIACQGPALIQGSVGSYATPVALSGAGAATQKMSITAPPPVVGAPPSSGTSAFSVAFTKKGTATGYLELNLTITLGEQSFQQSVPCASGKVPFTAKL